MKPDLGKTDTDAIARLLEVTRSITGVLDLDRLLQKVLNSAVEVLGAERGYLILLDPDENQPTEQRLRVKAAYRMDMDEILEVKFKASRTAILKVLDTGSAHHSDNALAEPDPSRSVELFGLRSIICHPLWAKERLLGALYVDSRITARFSPGARDILPSLAAQAAICIENATLVAEREEALRREHSEHVNALEMETWKNAMAAFVSVAAHDLKGPLTVIANGLSLLKRMGSLDAESQEVVADMQLSLQRAKRLVETYLDASALQDGRGVKLDIASVGLFDLVEAELSVIRKGPSADRFELHNEVPEECRVQADKERLQQILGNLIENAVKYSGKGRIEVRAEEVGDEVKIEIVDQGPGIAKELQSRLFDRYFRGESAARGTGLGLWIVRQLVESMEGRIELESEPGQGSTFRFFLPAAV